ncbi:hypothetical protein U9M48_008805 [Paspalum notatum var. saurae]|uniref:Myb/SANT-like domain-containing protein n=1 Tax=Paspalum notatum var. saurae TaxID=547442 RepID=A0AAQ3SQX2_PASNO
MEAASPCFTPSLPDLISYSIMKDDSGVWGDGKLKIVCEIFAEEVRGKNRSGTRLNRVGYANVIAKFKERTGQTYTKLQFKNKWDKLRKDYSNWKQLGKETRCNWNAVKKLYEAPGQWWKKINHQFKGISKFKDKSLEYEDELSIMFEDIRNTGDDHWAPTSGELPQDSEAQAEDEIDKDVNVEDDGGEDTPTSSKEKRRCVVDKEKGRQPNAIHQTDSLPLENQAESLY